MSQQPTPSHLVLNLEGPRVTADKFVRAVTALKDLVDEVVRQMVGKESAVRWLVTVKSGSVNLSFKPEAQKPSVPVPRIMKALSRGIRVVERRAVRPRYFSDLALQKAREIASLPDGREIEFARIRFDSVSVTVSRRTVEHVETILSAKFKDYGTVEGRLEMISLRGGPHFAIYDPLTDRPIQCHVPAGRLQEVQAAFGKRVAVSGVIRYNTDGSPLSVEVDEISIFPPAAELPRFDNVLGILGHADE